MDGISLQVTGASGRTDGRFLRTCGLIVYCPRFESVYRPGRSETATHPYNEGSGTPPRTFDLYPWPQNPVPAANAKRRGDV